MRRANRRAAARDPLRRALDLADRGGMLVLARRAREELKAAGNRPRRSALSGPRALTPAEHRVAQLAAEGHRNRAIAEQLYVTQRTVELTSPTPSRNSTSAPAASSPPPSNQRPSAPPQRSPAEPRPPRNHDQQPGNGSGRRTAALEAGFGSYAPVLPRRPAPVFRAKQQWASGETSSPRRQTKGVRRDRGACRQLSLSRGVRRRPRSQRGIGTGSRTDSRGLWSAARCSRLGRSCESRCSCHAGLGVGVSGRAVSGGGLFLPSLMVRAPCSRVESRVSRREHSFATALLPRP